MLQAVATNITSSEISKRELLESLKTKLSSASKLKSGEFVSTGHPYLDEVLGGGLELGSVSEWGMPLGQNSRAILLDVIKKISNDITARPILWSLGQPGSVPFASSFKSFGVELQRVFFAKTFRPIEDLREAFLEPVFSLVILDCPKSFSREDYAFISKQAVKMNCHVCILQPYLLNEGAGNVWARKRLNCIGMENGSLGIQVVRGVQHSFRKINLNYGVCYAG